MPIFQYKALDSENKVTEASLNANNKEEVASILQKKGLTPLSVQEQTDKLASKKTLPIVEKMTFCRYLGTMLKSGLSISDSIEVLAQEATHPLTKKLLNDVSYSLDHGQNLSSVFARYPNSFNKFFVTIVKSGEISGTLAETFTQLEEEIRAEHTLKQKIQGALLYPAVVFVAMGGIGVLMFFFILPQIAQVFLNLHLPLNPLVINMFKFTLFLGKHKYYILSASAVSIVAIIIFFKTKPGKTTFQKIVSPIPIVKNLIKQMDIARFCRTFSTLLATGVPITDALNIALDSMSYAKFRRLSQDITQHVTSGKSLAFAFKNTKIFPPLLTQMIASGEKSGTLDTSLKDLGEFYESEVESSVKKATQILEPILMLGVGIGVGAMVLTVITPIYSVVSNLQVQH